ncbi:hypothetical protein TNCV_3587121 [Trichonephila clavipes]|nr:hypothetical protein TNCV_3587121 [Trichonephila clavipes]
MPSKSVETRYRAVYRAVGSLGVRASDSRPEGLDSMPDATKYLPSTHGLTTNLQSKITSIANASCIPIGPSLLKSRPPLQAQVTDTKNITVPDRGLKAAGAA